MTYTVVPGDTLNSIAARFGVTGAEIAALNGIDNPDLIYVGQVLKLPQEAVKPEQKPQGEPLGPHASDFDEAKVNAPVQACLVDKIEPPEVVQNLRVLDREQFEGRDVIRPYDPATRSITIVQTKETDEVEIDYTGPDVPAELSVRLSSESDYYKIYPGGGSWKIPVTYRQNKLPYKSTFASLFTVDHQRCQYIIEGIPGRPIRVDVLNPDQWLLEIDVPPFDSFKVGYKGTVKSASASAGATASIDKGTGNVSARASVSVNMKTDIVKTTVVSKGGIFRNPSKTEIEQRFKNDTTLGFALWSKEGIDGPLDTGLLNFSQSKNSSQTAHAQNRPDPSLPVKLSLNGQYVRLDILQIIGTVLEFAKAIYELKEAIEDLKGQSKIGWYFDIEFKIADGSVIVGWGWREREDHLADYHVAIGAAITLYEVEAKIGVGFMIRGAGISAELFAKGKADLTLGPFEVIGPGDLGGLKIGMLSGQIEIGGRVVGKLGTIAKLAGEIKCGITMGCDVYYEDIGGMEAALKMVRDPVKVSVIARSKGNLIKARTYHKTLIEGANVFDDLRFPGRKVAPPEPFMTLEDVARRIDEHLTAGWWPIRFHQEVYSVGFFGNVKSDEKEFDSWRISMGLARRIHQRRELIDLTPRVVDGIAQAVREVCERLGKRRWRDSVDLDDWVDFLKSEEIEEILKSAESPIRKFEGKLNGNVA